MLTREDVKSLVDLDTGEWPLVSFYMRIDRRQVGEENYASTLRGLRRQGEDRLSSLDEARAQALKEDLQKIERVATDERVAGSHSLAVVASSGAGIWRTYHLPELSESSITIGNRVYLKPLVQVLDRYERYCVLLVNKERARLFIVYLGEITDYSEIFDQVPGKHDQGGWSQSRFQRHHDDHVMRHLKRTADLTFDFFQREGFEHLIIGGTEEAISQLPDYLHSYLKDRLVGTISIDIDATTKEVLEQSLEVESRRESQVEAESVSMLKGELRSQGQAVAGLEATVQAVQQGQVLRLLVDDDFRASGIRCTACNALSAGTEPSCEYCDGEVERIEDLVNVLVGLVMKQDGDVEFISDENLRGEMKELGGIGALLRYRSG